jgi:hypothetical protein
MLELFTNPGYLAAGAALVSAPIIIHLINRMRFKRLRWAAMEFLLKSQKRNRRRLIIEQLILLALRCILVALVGLLVMRFVGFTFAGFHQQDALHIVVLDDTLSMSDQWREADTPKNAFLVAKNDVIVDRIAKNISQSSTRDSLILIPLSRVATDRTFQPKTYSKLNDKKHLDELKNDLELLAPSKLHVDVLQGIKKAQEIINNTPPEKTQITLHIVSDLRQRDWNMPEKESLQKMLHQLATSKVKIWLRDTVHPYRLPGQGGIPASHDNIGILDLRPGTRVAGKDMPVSFTVEVGNFSAREANVNVTIFDDFSGQEMLQVDFNPPMPVKIPAGTTVKASFELRFNPQIKANETYFAQISARLESAQRGKLDNDGLAEDNVRHAAVEIRDKVPVLVIDGEGPRGRQENNDSFFIRNAIISVPGASYEVVFGDLLGGGLAAKALERSDLHQYPTIFLLNVQELTPNTKQLTNLENYIKEGGGVGFFLGPRVNGNWYNKNLYKAGQGLFPVPLRENFFPPNNEEARKTEVTGQPHLLLRDEQYPTIEQYPIFGPIFTDPKQRVFLNDLPVRRYFQVPRGDWRPEPGKVEELATLPNEQFATDFLRATLDIVRSPTLEKLLNEDEFRAYRPGIERHRQTIEKIVSPGSEMKAYHLGSALNNLLVDTGRKDDKAYPNLTEFWSHSEPKVRSLHQDLKQLRDQVLYGDPFVVKGQFGKGRVVAVMTTAGKEWSDWGGGSDASLIYQPFIWEMQNFLSSQGSEGNLTVGTPVQIVVDSDQYKKKEALLKMARIFKKARQGQPGEDLKDTEQFGEETKGQLTFRFDKTMEPGLYVSKLVSEDDPEATRPLASWGHVYNVDTAQEGKLLRVSSDELEKNLIREAPQGAIRIEGPQASGDDLINKRSDLSESPLFFLIFLTILIAEQALAVHLSFHLKGAEGELPAQVSRSQRKAA